MNKLIFVCLLIVVLLSGCAAPAPIQVPTAVVPQVVPTATVQTHPYKVSGKVLDFDGQPIAGAVVLSYDNDSAHTAADGSFSIYVSQSPIWLRVEAAGYISRTRAAAAGEPLLFRLSPDDGKTIVINFGGDTMMGRRFFDPNEDGNPNDGYLATAPTLENHLKLLWPIKPLIENADISVVNLESVIYDPPYFSLIEPRPTVYHKTKDYVYATSPEAIPALKRIGIDLVDIGNNHVYDALETGMRYTLDALAREGMPHFGAGMNEDEAWKPVLMTVKGQKLAFIGCATIWTKVGGTASDVSYVADDALSKGGAARCRVDRLEKEVALVKELGYSVILMVHGGDEYEIDQAGFSTQVTDAAKKMGVDFIVNHHPHVVDSFYYDGTTLVAKSLGNFIFDQTVWPTFETYMLTLYIREGEIIRAFAEPLMLKKYIARGLTGDLADNAIRTATGKKTGLFVLENSALELDLRHEAKTQIDQMKFEEGTKDQIVPLPRGMWVTNPKIEGSVLPGHDLLWIGDFEDQDVSAVKNEAPLWESGGSAVFDKTFAYSGEVGMQLSRTSQNLNDAVTSHLHRILIPGGTKISVTGMVKGTDRAKPFLQLSWYADTKGSSFDMFKKPIELAPNGEWSEFRFDVTVPKEAIAMGMYLRLPPPASGSARVNFDDLKIIAWEEAWETDSPYFDHVLVSGAGSIDITQSVLPGWPD